MNRLILPVLGVCSLSIFSGCVLFRQLPTYQIVESQGLMASNSPAIFRRVEAERKKLDDGIEFSSEIIVQNTGISESPIWTNKAYLLANGAKIPLQCNPQSTSGPYVLPASSRIKIECMTKIVPNRENKMARRDTKAEVIIPTGDKEQFVLKFRYSFRIEEFQ